MKLRQVVVMSVLAWGLLVSRASAGQERQIQVGTDPLSGAVVRVLQGSNGAIRVEVTGNDVQVRRELAKGRMTTLLRGRAEEIRLESDGRSLTLTNASGRIIARRNDRQRLEDIRRQLSASALVHRAADLVGAIGFGDRAPLRPVLLTTRVFLQTMAGERPDLEGLHRWVQQARSRTAVRLVRLDDDGPTECWDTYVKEAIAAYIEYENCMKSSSWWDLLSQAACATIYEMRAIGAFAWWVKCVGLRG